MAEDLAKEWSKLKLTEEEDTVVVAKGKKIAAADRRITLSLAGRLLTQKPYDKKAFKSTIEMLWKPRKGLVIKELDAKTFVFQFFSEGDRQRVLDHEPWSFDNHLLALKEIRGEDKPDDIRFNKACFWVKASNVPFGARDLDTAKLIGDTVGRFIEYDPSVDFGWEKAMNIRVEVDITKPLWRGMKMAFDDIGTIWIDFKYRFLPNYCYVCGLIGHLDKECQTFGEEIKVLGLQYGSWLRVTPNKMGRRQTQGDREKEKQLFASLEKEPTSCRRTINFDHGSSAAGDGDEKETTDASLNVKESIADAVVLKAGGGAEVGVEKCLVSHRRDIDQHLYEVGNGGRNDMFEGIWEGAHMQGASNFINESVLNEDAGGVPGDGKNNGSKGWRWKKYKSAGGLTLGHAVGEKRGRGVGDPEPMDMEVFDQACGKRVRVLESTAFISSAETGGDRSCQGP